MHRRVVCSNKIVRDLACASTSLFALLVCGSVHAQQPNLPELLEGEMRQKVLMVLEHELKNHQALMETANALGYKPAGFNKYYKENDEIIRANIERVKSRKAVSSKRYLDYSRKKAAHITELSPNSLFMDIVRHEAHYQSEASKPQSITLCAPNGGCTTSEIQGAYQLDPIQVAVSKPGTKGNLQFSWKKISLAEAHALASTAMQVRQPTLRLGHVLGDLNYTIKDKRDNLSALRQKATDLKIEIQRIEQRLSENRKDLEKAEKNLGKVAEQEDKRLKPFVKAYREAADKLDKLNSAYKKRNAEGQIANGHPEHVRSLQQEWSRKSFALEALEDQLTRTDNAGVRQSRDDLKTQLTSIRNKLTEMGAPIDAKKSAPRTPREQEKLEKAEIEFEAVIQKLNQERKLSYSALSPKRNRVHAVQSTIADNTQLLAQLSKQLVKAKKAAWLYDAGGLPNIEIVETRDARYELKPGIVEKAEELDQKIAFKMQMHAEINKSIADLQAKQNKLRKAADDAANDLRDASQGSYYKQAVAQWVVQSLMVLKDGKGASVGALAASVNQIAVNLIFPPDYYDITEIKDGDITTTRHQTKKRAVGAAQSGISQIANQAVTPPEMKLIEKVLKTDWVGKNMDKAASKIPLLKSGREQALEELRGFQQAQSKGLKKRMLKSSADAAVGLVVDFLTEEMKSKISELATSEEFQTYLDAQIEFGQSVKEATLLKFVSEKDLEDLEKLQRQRRALGRTVETQDLPDEQSWRVEYSVKKNERFDAEAGYWFSVTLKEPSETLTISKPLDFDLYIEGQKLQLASTTSKYNKMYTLDAAQAKFIEDKIYKDKLTLTVSIK